MKLRVIVLTNWSYLKIKLLSWSFRKSIMINASLSTYHLERSEKIRESLTNYHLDRSKSLKGSLLPYRLECSENLRESFSTYHLERSDRLKVSVNLPRGSVERSERLRKSLSTHHLEWGKRLEVSVNLPSRAKREVVGILVQWKLMWSCIPTTSSEARGKGGLGKLTAVTEHIIWTEKVKTTLRK